MELKIKIKERVIQERYLTEEEELMYQILRHSIHGSAINKIVLEYFEDIGFNYVDYEEGNKGKFKTEIIRLATVSEMWAYHKTEINKLGWWISNLEKSEIEDTLKHKEIVFEVVE